MHALDTDHHSLVSSSSAMGIEDAQASRHSAHHSEHGEETEQHSAPLSYFKSLDFCELLICVVFAVVCAIVEVVDSRSIRERPIPYQLLENAGDIVYNLSLTEQLTDDTVSNLVLILVAIVAPLVLQLILTRFSSGRHGESHKTLCVYLVGLGLTTLVTALIKNYVGYLRPVFYEMCDPDVVSDECTSSDEREARRSFPSGHASTSFCGLILLTLYLLDHFGVYGGKHGVIWRENGNGDIVYHYNKPPRYKRGVSLLCLVPMALATFIAASRVVDNKHFPADVATGALLGSTVGYFVHRLWFLPWPFA